MEVVAIIDFVSVWEISLVIFRLHFGYCCTRFVFAYALCHCYYLYDEKIDFGILLRDFLRDWFLTNYNHIEILILLLRYATYV